MSFVQTRAGYGPGQDFAFDFLGRFATTLEIGSSIAFGSLLSSGISDLELPSIANSGSFGFDAVRAAHVGLGVPRAAGAPRLDPALALHQG